MPVTDFLERNVKLYGNETALVELNPEMPETRRMTWKEFDTKANRFANLLMTREVKKGDKVLISKYSGTNVKLEGEEYIIVRMEDILAVVDSNDADDDDYRVDPLVD